VAPAEPHRALSRRLGRRAGVEFYRRREVTGFTQDDTGVDVQLSDGPWADRVQLVDAKYVGTWELPALGPVTAPTAVLIRPDGYVASVRDLTQLGLADALTTWFGPPTAA
jgi:hypothetical protein